LGNIAVRVSWEICVSHATTEHYCNTRGEHKFRRKKGTFYEWMVHAHETQSADGEDPADDEMASEKETTDIAEITAGATTLNTMKNSATNEKISHVRAILSNDHNTE